MVGPSQAELRVDGSRLVAPDSFTTIRARLAAHSKWAKTVDRTAATAPARAAAAFRFEREVDPEGSLPADIRTRLAESARKAYYTRLALLSAKSRARSPRPRVGRDGSDAA